MTTKEQNRKYVADSRTRDLDAGIVRVEVRVPAEKREWILDIARLLRESQASGKQRLSPEQLAMLKNQAL